MICDLLYLDQLRVNYGIRSIQLRAATNLLAFNYVLKERSSGDYDGET
jgi:hypothetical protein